MKKFFLIPLCLFLLLESPAHAEDAALSTLLNAKTIRCFSGTGYSSTFDGNKLESEEGVFSSKAEDSFVSYTKIDLQKGYALVVGNAGSDDIQAIAKEKGLHFLDFTDGGGLVIATVFANRNSEGQYFYTTSRHVQLDAGKALTMTSQYTGLCTILE